MHSIRKRHFNQIPLLEVYPTDHINDPLSTIIYYHGWRSSKELVLTNARKLADAGFRVFAPDALNHGERISKVSPIRSFTFWQTIQANIVEFNQIIDHADRLGLIDRDKIGVMGVSMGGMTTSALLGANDFIKAAACLMGTPELVNYRNLIFARSKAMGDILPEPFWQTLSWVENFDLLAQPEKIKNRPFYLWHDQQDPKVPFSQVSDFYEQTKDNPQNQNMTFVRTDEYGHLLTQPIMNETVAFFKESLLWFLCKSLRQCYNVH